MSRAYTPDELIVITKELGRVDFGIPTFPYRENLPRERLRLAVSKAEWERMLAHMANYEMFLADRNKLAVDRLEVNGIELVIDERL